MKQTIFAALALLALLSSCCIPCMKSSPKIADLESATWTLIELNNNPVENSPITLHFNAADKMVNGTAPCNSFFSGYELLSPKKGDSRNIEFRNAGATLRACPDMKIEQSFIRQLTSVSRIKMEGEHMLMSNAGDSLIAVFVRAKMQ